MHLAATAIGATDLKRIVAIVAEKRGLNRTQHAFLFTESAQRIAVDVAIHSTRCHATETNGTASAKSKLTLSDKNETKILLGVKTVIGQY